jgi:hypothetical protein
MSAWSEPAPSITSRRRHPVVVVVNQSTVLSDVVVAKAPSPRCSTR